MLRIGTESRSAAAGLLALIFAASPVLAGVHAVVVQHYYCARHQALEHAHGPGPRHGESQPIHEGVALHVLTAWDYAEHVQCGVQATGVKALEPARPAQGCSAPPAGADVSVTDQDLPRPRPILALAPKNSPPLPSASS